MSKKTCYILGPMTGYPDDNRPAFRQTAEELRRLGYEVISPDELDQTHPIPNAPDHATAWAEYLKRDIPHLLKADFAVALSGWRESKGAMLEATILGELGVPVHFGGPWGISYPSYSIDELPYPSTARKLAALTSPPKHPSTTLI